MSEHDIDWKKCTDIADQCQEEIETFYHDGTNDNAIALVRKVLHVSGVQQLQTKLAESEARVGMLLDATKPSGNDNCADDILNRVITVARELRQQQTSEEHHIYPKGELLNAGMIQADLALRIEKLQRQNAELVARVGRLERKLKTISDAATLTNLDWFGVKELLNETPQQSLQHIQADAVISNVSDWLTQVKYMEGLSAHDLIDSIELWLDELRQQQINGSDGK